MEACGLGMNSQKNSGVNNVETAVKAKYIKVQSEICKTHHALLRHRISLYGRCLNDLMVECVEGVSVLLLLGRRTAQSSCIYTLH